jgi:hypothetical protein
MSIRTSNAVKQLIANDFTDYRGPRFQNLLNNLSMCHRRMLYRQPFWTATAGLSSSDVIHVLDSRH